MLCSGGGKFWTEHTPCITSCTETDCQLLSMGITIVQLAIILQDSREFEILVHTSGNILANMYYQSYRLWGNQVFFKHSQSFIIKVLANPRIQVISSKNAMLLDLGINFHSMCLLNRNSLPVALFNLTQPHLRNIFLSPSSFHKEPQSLCRFFRCLIVKIFVYKQDGTWFPLTLTLILWSFHKAS